jgi:hypothetical protein
MRILILLSLCGASLALAGCGDIAPQQPVAKQKPTAKTKDVNKPDPQAFAAWRNSLRDESRYLQVSSDFGIKETMVYEACERLRDLVNEMFSKQGSAPDSAYSSIHFQERIKSGPETYQARLEICRARLRNLRKNLDEQKRDCPDTPALLGLYCASREMIDGMERLIDERYAPLTEQIYDDKLTEEEKRAAVEPVRIACYQEADRLHRARLDARAAYRRDRIDQVNQLVWKKTVNPAYKPAITTIPPPAAAKK